LLDVFPIVPGLTAGQSSGAFNARSSV